jgi:hypothetical protein
VLSVLIAGAAYELAYLLWLAASARSRPILSAVLSMVTGAISVYGISSVVSDRSCLPWLLAGYGLGSYGTVKLSTLLSKSKDV